MECAALLRCLRDEYGVRQAGDNATARYKVLLIRHSTKWIFADDRAAYADDFLCHSLVAAWIDVVEPAREHRDGYASYVQGCLMPNAVHAECKPADDNDTLSGSRFTQL